MGNNKIIRLKVNPMPSAAAHGYPFCFTPSGCVAAFHPREAAAGERLTLGADQKSWAAKVFDSAYAWLEILESLQETMVFTVFTYSRQTRVIYHRTYCRKLDISLLICSSTIEHIFQQSHFKKCSDAIFGAEKATKYETRQTLYFFH
jgi:hypothetical protein